MIKYLKLEKLGTFYSGLNGKNKNDFKNGNSKYIPYINVFNNLEIDFNKFETVFINDGEKQNYLEYGDIVFTGSSEIKCETGLTSVVTKDVNEKIYLNSFCFIFRFDDKNILIPSFCKYLFRSKEIRKQIIKCCDGVTRFNLSKSKLKNITIPIPPLDIQNKIVEILDSFTNYKAELTAELTARIKQYEYYRDKLLDFSKNKQVEYKHLWECTIWNKKFKGVDNSKQTTRNKIKSISAKQLKDLLTNNGDIKLISTGNFDGFTSEGKAKEFINNDEIITIPEGGRANIKYWKGKFVNALNLVAISSDKKKYNIKYLYYYLLSINGSIEDKFRGSGVKHPDMNEILDISIPIPPLDIQNKIVEILDNFSSLVNEISNGLPLEIKLRNKQYEYYRDLLLNFKGDCN